MPMQREVKKVAQSAFPVPWFKLPRDDVAAQGLSHLNVKEMWRMECFCSIEEASSNAGRCLGAEE
jgi:hypothetical protein